jgi:hypothetical protein
MKTNFRGEPIHEVAFTQAVDDLRTLLVGRTVTIHSDINMYPRCKSCTGSVSAIYLTPDYDSFDISLGRGTRIGASFPKEGETAKTGDNIVGLKVDVMAGRCDRWIEL